MVRVKERYLLINIQYPEAKKPNPTIPDVVVWHQPTTSSLSPDKLLRAIKQTAQKYFGKHGQSCLETISVKYLSNATSTFILRVGRPHFRLLWSTLTLMDVIPVKNGSPCVFNVVRVCGTIKKAEQEAIRRARSLVLIASDHSRAATQSDDTLGNIFGGGREEDVEMVDFVDFVDSDDDGESEDN
ncbi:Ribonuclease P/MRP protein subunit POP5 [Zalerion maritima]|uniref:Ribonuclease P/MRP protein subunit POP5 n=1 Tax=Zalerion maritima TaxID=339359 RepID=A0AAD5RW53_9PEZI|nr:Ribonuclease P/MRP protein subunit POP5 [Zalerion maritima]